MRQDSAAPGTHTELLALKGGYFKLVEQQQASAGMANETPEARTGLPRSEGFEARGGVFGGMVRIFLARRLCLDSFQIHCITGSD